MKRIKNNGKYVCSTCNNGSYYFQDRDLFACIKCNIWLEEPCSCSKEDECHYYRVHQIDDTPESVTDSGIIGEEM